MHLNNLHAHIQSHVLKCCLQSIYSYFIAPRLIHLPSSVSDVEAPLSSSSTMSDPFTTLRFIHLFLVVLHLQKALVK